MNQWIHFFGDGEQLQDAKELLGGKGASLSDMTRAGLNVPPGFTVTTAACRHYYESGLQWPPGLEDEVRGNLSRLELETGRSFGAGRLPLFVSVRSGAAVSMPGMMDTILNCGIHPALAEAAGDTPQFWHVFIQFVETYGKVVAGLPREALAPAGAPCRAEAERLMGRYRQETGHDFPTDPWTLLCECVNAVFRSWNSERAIAYRKRNSIRGLAGTAVTVQAMFPSRVSGVVFTQDPNHLAAQRLVIESSYGLGEAVVSGDVTPDRFLVSRADFSSVETFPGTKSGAVSALGDDAPHDAEMVTLTPAQLRELCDLSMRVERYFGDPMDIEFGLADGKFSLLQSRAIRGLDVAQDAEAAREEAILRLRELSAKRRRVWVTHNLRETLRSPTPLTWDIVRKFMSGSGGFGLMYQDFGYRPSAEVCDQGFLQLICGRIYADPERVSQLFWGGLPVGYDVQAILKNKNALDQPPTKFEPERADETLLFKLPGAIGALVRSSRAMKRARANAKRAFEEEALPPHLEYVRTKRGESLEELPTAGVIAELRDRCRRVLDDFGKESLKPPFFAGVALGKLEGLLAQILGAEEGARLAGVLTMALENDSTFEQDSLLYRVATGETSMETFLEKYGHRATSEMELSEPRWREDQTYLKKIIAQIQRPGSRSLDQMHGENMAKSAEARRLLPARLAEWGGSSFLEEIERHLTEARNLLPYRERGKHYLMMGYELVRLAISELGLRWEIEDDVYFLHMAELDEFEARREELKKEIARRKTRWRSAQRLDLPDVIDSEHLSHLGIPQEAPDADELQGDAVSSGVASGWARIVFNPREVDDLGSDYVLVCPSTDPGWTPLFINARALIVERGGVLSHGAIVARDFGIPAVVCPGATTSIKDGDRLRVDGNSGRITKITEAV